VKTEIATRTATIADIGVLAHTMREGFGTYASFAPRGWAPPPLSFERARIADRLPRPDAWCLVAEDDGVAAGHVALLEDTEPGVAYLWMLFVREPWWGTGLAHRLHGLAVAEAVARGSTAMRLFTPARHSRARAFYEREGWQPAGAPTWEPMLALDLVEYRRDLP
jgi:GNAT superfamily N-acetyltransferase